MHLSKYYISISFRSIAGSGQFKPVQCTWQIDSIRNSMVCHVTSNSDFHKEVVQFRLSGLKLSVNIVTHSPNYRSERSASKI